MAGAHLSVCPKDRISFGEKRGHLFPRLGPECRRYFGTIILMVGFCVESFSQEHPFSMQARRIGVVEPPGTPSLNPGGISPISPGGTQASRAYH